jgi:aspartyl protease family protein
VKLVSSSAREAVIEIGGRTRTLGLSREVGAAYAEPSRRQVAVPRNEHGQYRVGGTINGHATTLLVDTGANVVALSGDDARRMGIDYRRDGTRTAVRTASGVVPAWDVMLDRVETGGILVRNVQASVIEGAHPSPPLLGMSWLARVGMREESGVLYLQEH